MTMRLKKKLKRAKKPFRRNDNTLKRRVLKWGPTCPKCKLRMNRKKGEYGFFWQCSDYPWCDVRATEHPDGTIKGIPADGELRGLKMEAHRLCDTIWGKWKTPAWRGKEMYAWLAENTRTGHIGLMTKKEVIQLIKRLQRHPVFLQECERNGL